MNEEPIVQASSPSSANDNVTERGETNFQKVTVAERAVLSEGDHSVAIGQAEGNIINTGEIHGDVQQHNYYINVAAESPTSGSVTSDIGAALNLVKLNQSLSSELARKMLSELEDARELFREGATGEGIRRVRALRASQNWEALDDSLRALTLRVLAHMTLGVEGKGGVAQALALVDEAKQIDPSGDDVTIRARLKVYTEGYDAALAEIGQPTTLDAFNLRVGVLVEKNDVEEALKALRHPPSGIALDAESHRLFALALLVARDIEGAQEEIGKARAAKPRRQIIRLGAAVIDYYSSLSPKALQPLLIPYPYPIHPSMVKRDTESQSRLLRAAEEFKQVAAQMKPGSNSQKEIETWQIACLANISERETEAVELCEASLQRDPGNFRVLSWVLYRNYALDISESQSRLEQAVQEGGGDEAQFMLHEILTLIGIYLKKGTPEKALSLLDNQKALFDTSGHLDLWWYWRGQALIASGNSQTSIDEADQIKERSLRNIIKIGVLADNGNRTGNFQPLIDYLEQAYEELKDDELFIQLCEVKAQTGDWKYAADHAEEYCDLIGTASAAYFAIAAAWNAHRTELCLSLLDKYQSLFPDNNLPRDLRRVRVYCKLKNADISGALSEAEDLTHESNEIENIFALLEVLRTKGDFAEIEATVKRLRHREGLTAMQLLQLAGLIKLEDPNLAREFWRRAKDDALNDPLLAGYAFDLAFKLGLDREVGPLMGRMHELAQSGEAAVQIVTIEQMLEMMSENREHRDQVQELYGKGEAPLSLVAKRVGRPLADIFSGLADENQAAHSLHTRPRIFVRYGARLLPPIENFQHSDRWRLHLDITSLLLADHLNLLDSIEGAFKPLYISRKVSTALLMQRNELLESQQSRFDNYRVILKLIEQGRLRVSATNSPALSDQGQQIVKEALDDKTEFPTDNPQLTDSSEGQRQDEQDSPKTEEQTVSPDIDNGESSYEVPNPESLTTQLGQNRLEMLTSAYSEDGFAVGFLPLHSYGDVRQTLLWLPTLLRNRIINCRAVADSLLAHDRISERVATQAVQDLGQESNPDISPAIPLPGAKLFLMEGVADVLAGAGVLERACDSFEVTVSAKCADEARVALLEYERRAKVEERVRNLAKRISDGLEDGTYKFIHISDERLQVTPDFEDSDNINFASTLDLFRYEPVEWDILCIDDRAINKYPFRDSAPIIAVNEVLLALRQREIIDKHQYYELLLKLRAQNFRYIPVDEDEILYHLKQAPVRDGEVVETDALTILRRYLASCLLDEEYLQHDPPTEGTPNQFGERPFITQCLIDTNDAITAAWADESVTEEVATARADWILNNLYFGLFGCQHLRETQDSLTLIARDIAGLLLKAISISSDLNQTAQEKQKRNLYFSWLTSRILFSRFKSDPNLLPAVAGEVKRIFRGFSLAPFESAQQKLVTQFILQKLFVDLPEEIQREIDFDRETTEWLGLKNIPLAVIGGLSFEIPSYLHAIELALAGKEAPIKSYEPEAEFRFAIAENTSVGQSTTYISPPIAVFDIQNNLVGVMRDPLFGLLSATKEERKATLERFRYWFDGSQEEFEKEVREIIEISDPQQRLEHARSKQQQSCEAFYQALEQKLRHGEEVYSNDLAPPSADSLLKRFRLSPAFEGNFSAVWREATQSLLNDKEIAIAIERCACLPVAMPEAVIQAVGDLTSVERKALLGDFVSRWGSPLMKLQLIGLALRVAKEDLETVGLAEQLLATLYNEDPGAADFAAFEAVLSFVNQEFGVWKETKSWAPQIKLAMIWAHATRLHNLFRTVGYSADDIASMFRRQIRHLNAESLQREPDLWDDCLHPHRLSRPVFLTHGAAKLFYGIEPQILEKSGAIRLIRERTLSEEANGIQFPAVQLLRDSALARDGLGSILGGDRSAALAPVLGTEGIEFLASEKLKEIVGQVIDDLLQDQNNFGAWAQLLAIVDDLPIYSDLKVKLETLVRKLDISQLYTADHEKSPLALSLAAKQVRYLPDEGLRSEAREHVLQAVKLELNNPANKDDDDALSKRIAALMDVGLILSIAPGDLKSTGRNMAKMMEKIEEVWADFGDQYGYTMMRLFWELPTDISPQLWPLLLKLRATMEKGL